MTENLLVSADQETRQIQTKRQDKSRPEDKIDPDIVVRVLKIQTFTWETLKKSKRWQNSINIQSSKVQSLIKNCQKTNHLLWETWPRPAKWIHSEVEGDMMWDIYEDDDSFEKMAKAKVTLISCYHKRMKCWRFFHLQSLLTKTNDGVVVTYISIDVFFSSSVEFMMPVNIENLSSVTTKEELSNSTEKWGFLSTEGTLEPSSRILGSTVARWQAPRNLAGPKDNLT